MYKKVEKTFKEPFGIRKAAIQDLVHPIVFFNVPLGKERAINGYLDSLVYLLRLRKGENINLGLDVSEVPFELFCSSENEPNAFFDIIDNIKDIDIDKLKKLFRNINFVSYCDGNNRLLTVIDSIHNQLIDKGLGEEEIAEVMSQISVLQIVDNLGYDGDAFPYVTTLTIHNRHDVENDHWLEEGLESKRGQFSKAFVKRLTDNKEVLVVEPFGEESLQPGYEHNYSDDYLLFPVINALMSVCLIESLNSSLNGTSINIDTYNEGLNFVLTKAHEYENKLGKDLNSLNKEELKVFSQYMMEIMTEYVKEKLNIKDVDLSKVDKKVKREKDIGEIAIDLSTRYESLITGNIKKILNYKDSDLDATDTIPISNTRQTLPIKQIIYIFYNDLLKNVKDSIKGINSVSFPSRKDEELEIELIEWKKERISDIYKLLDNEDLKEILSKCGLEIEEGMKL